MYPRGNAEEKRYRDKMGAEDIKRKRRATSLSDGVKAGQQLKTSNEPSKINEAKMRQSGKHRKAKPASRREMMHASTRSIMNWRLGEAMNNRGRAKGARRRAESNSHPMLPDGSLI